MDSQRRHQLQSNSLSLILLDLPGEIKEHASQIVMVLAVLALIASLIYYRVSSRAHGLVQAQADLSTARTAIDQLQTPPPPMGDLKNYASYRRLQAGEASTALNEASSLTSDAKVLAEIQIARGDLAWNLANSAQLPGAATQPALQLDQTRDSYLKDAEAAYNTVLNQYSDQKEATIAAKFGLAAIAEDQHKWDDAAHLYSSLQDDPTVTAAYRDLAQNRLAALPALKTPARIGTTQPSAK